MVQTYQEFKDHLVTFLWKAGDQQLIDSLDNLIRMGNNKLLRELRVEVRHASAVIAATKLKEPLPADYHAMRSVVNTDSKYGEFRYTTPANLKAIRDRLNNNYWQSIYSLEQNNLLLCGPVQELNPENQPLNLEIDYIRNIPDFKNTDQSWLTEDYLDIYTYAVLYHTAPFVREDERVQVWSSMYEASLLRANEDAQFEQARGVSKSKPLPRQAGIRRRRSHSRNRAY